MGGITYTFKMVGISNPGVHHQRLAGIGMIKKQWNSCTSMTEVEKGDYVHTIR